MVFRRRLQTVAVVEGKVWIKNVCVTGGSTGQVEAEGSCLTPATRSAMEVKKLSELL